MEFLIGLFAVAAIVAGLVLARHMSLVTGCLLVIISGITVGHPFWHADAGPIPLTLDRMMWSWLILSFGGLTLLRRTEPAPLNRVDVMVILLAVALVAGTFAWDWRYRENLPLSRLLFFNLIPMGFYFVARHCKLRESHLYIVYSVLALFGLYLGVVSIAEQREWTALVYPTYILDPVNFEFLGRARGPFLNPVSLGIYLATCLVAGAGLWRVSHPLVRTGLLGLVLVLITASLLTLTRSVWVGCALAVAIVCWFPAHRQVRGGLVVAGTLVVVCLALLFADKLNRFQRDKHVTEAEMAESVTLRPMLAYVALKMFRDRPLFGHGFGQYTAAKKPYHYNETADLPLRKALPYMQHNVFLSYATETGFVGLALLALLLGTAAVRAWRLWQTVDRPWGERWFGLVMLAFLANYVVNGLFHDVSIIPHTAALWYLLLGIQENVIRQRLAFNAGAGEGEFDARVAA